MITLKDIAKDANVSVASVSLVLNGKDDGRVSQKTKKEIENSIKKLGYVHTKRRIQPYAVSKTIAIFWSLDSRRSFLGPMFDGFSKSITNSKHANKYDFVIHPYEVDRLFEKKEILTNKGYSGAIIANTSTSDVQFLRTLNNNMPIVLINRHLPSLHGVFIDNNEVAKKAAEIIKEKGYHSIAAVGGFDASAMIKERYVLFIEHCKNLNIEIKNEFQFQVNDSISGGQEAAKSYCKKDSKPKIVFCATDTIAFGFELGLREKNINLPKDCALFCFGFNSEQLTEMAYPSISSIDISVNTIAEEAVILLFDIIKHNTKEIQHIELNYKINLRDTFN